VRIFPGDHFFLLDPANRQAVAAALTDFVCGVTEPSPL
jgi:surfactin synthase thioesterase subunit